MRKMPASNSTISEGSVVAPEVAADAEGAGTAPVASGAMTGAEEAPAALVTKPATEEVAGPAPSAPWTPHAAAKKATGTHQAREIRGPVRRSRMISNATRTWKSSVPRTEARMSCPRSGEHRKEPSRAWSDRAGREGQDPKTESPELGSEGSPTRDRAVVELGTAMLNRAPSPRIGSCICRPRSASRPGRR